MADMEVREFEVSLKEVPVLLHDSKTGLRRECFIREMTGGANESYMDGSQARFDTTLTDDGEIKVKAIKTFKGTYSDLLSKCLFDKTTGNLLTLDEVNAIPATVQKELFKLAQEINGLTKKKAEDAKNESEAGD